jgi:hypothetical protein
MAGMDLMTLLQEYGLFVALVAFVIWDNRQREANYKAREDSFIQETREREQKYIDREERYISIVEGLSNSYEEMQKDISQIKDKLEV